MRNTRLWNTERLTENEQKMNKMLLKVLVIVVVCLAASAQGAEKIETEDLDIISEIESEDTKNEVDISSGIENNVEDKSSKQDAKNADELENQELEIADTNDEKSEPRKWKGLKMCLDRRGDCKSVLRYCPSLKGMCDKSCGFCTGLLSPKHTFVFGLEEIALKKGNLVARVPYIGREYSISFDLLPTVFGTGTRSVIHFTVSNRNSAQRGDRQPGVWFYSVAPTALKNRLLICADVSGNRNHCYGTNTFIEKNRWVNISVSQKHVFGGYYYSIIIDGHVIYTLRNTSPAAYKQVFVYGADPWHNAAEGKIKNLVIKTSE